MENVLGGLTVENAEITRLEDENDWPVFRSTVSVITNANMNPVQRTVMTIVHSPNPDDPVEYKGTLWIIAENAHSNQHSQFANVLYERSGTESEPHLKVSMRTATFAASVDPITSSGVLDYNLGDETNANIPRYFNFDLNPLTNEGVMSFWRGFGYQYLGATHGSAFSISAGSDGRLAGCGLLGQAGNGNSILKATDLNVALTPMCVGAYCPDNVFTKKVHKSCFAQNAEGLYLVDTTTTGDANGYVEVLNSATGVTIPDILTLTGFTQNVKAD
jgi:hypothetical protein